MKKEPSHSTLAASVLIGTTLFLGYYLFAIEFKRRQVPIESVPGAVVFGVFLVLYLGWFVFDTFVNEKDKTLSEALTFNATKNPAFWAGYAYFLVFGYACIDTAF